MVSCRAAWRYSKIFATANPKLIIDSKVRIQALRVRSAARKVRSSESRVRRSERSVSRLHGAAR